MIVNKMDDLIEKMKKMHEELAYLYNLKYELVKPYVYQIINNQIKDPQIVEHVLDEFLDIPTDKGYELLKLLCNYWKNIEKKSADFYLDEYEKMYIK